MEVGGFTEFVGQSRGDGCAWREQRGGHAVGIANHKGHRHGLTQCPTQSQHDAADHAFLGVRQHDVAHHFPSGTAQAIGRFAQDGRRDFEHIAHHRSHKRQDHEGQHNAGCQNAHAVRGATEQKPNQGHTTQHFAQRHLDVIGKQWRKHKQAKHTVNDGGHRRQQFNGRTQRAS